MKKILCSLTMVLFISCSSELLLPNNFEEELTVEAYIEAGKRPKVYLTTNLSLSGANQIDLLKAIEGNAKVEILHALKTEIATLSVDNTRYPSRYYRFDEVIGNLNETYQLKITLNNKIYTGQTYIPSPPTIESIQSVVQSTLPNNHGKYNLHLQVKNTNQPMYCKMYIKHKNEGEFVEATPFLVDNLLYKSSSFDVFLDYTTYHTNGYLVSNLAENNIYDVKMVAITKAEYDFWSRVKGNSLDFFDVQFLANPIPSNINNAFGFFGGSSSVSESFYLVP